jgi:hypothetical protein
MPAQNIAMLWFQHQQRTPLVEIQTAAKNEAMQLC